MNTVELLKRNAEFAYKELLDAIEGVTQGQAWGVMEERGSDYIHTDGSILGITLHIAGGKFIYGSVGFKESEVRWRDCANKIEEFEPDWTSAKDYLAEAHAYWLNSWSGLLDNELESDHPHFRGKMWPAWKIIQMVTFHDTYHAGQIALIRYGVGESEIPPPSVAEDIRKYCVELPSW